MLKTLPKTNPLLTSSNNRRLSQRLGLRMQANILCHLRHLSATTCPSMALRRPFLFPSLKLKHSPFLPPLRPRFSVRALSSSPSSFRARFSRQRPDAPRERSRDRIAVRESPKSLVDDEAELSDWVNELRTSSYRGKLTSDEDDDGGGNRRMRVRNDKRRRGSDDEEPSPRWKNSPGRQYGSEYEENVGMRSRMDHRRGGDRNKGRSTGFRDSVARKGSGSFDSVRKVASFSEDDDEFQRGRFRKGDDGRVGNQNKGRSSSFSNSHQKQGRGGSDRVRKGTAFSDEDEELGRGRFMQGIDGLMSDDETDEEEEGDDDGGLFSEGSGRSVGDRNKGRSTGFSNSNGTREKGSLNSVRKIDAAFDKREDFNMGMFKEGIHGLISEDDEDDGDGVDRAKEGNYEEKEEKIVEKNSYLSETR